MKKPFIACLCCVLAVAALMLVRDSKSDASEASCVQRGLSPRAEGTQASQTDKTPQQSADTDTAASSKDAELTECAVRTTISIPPTVANKKLRRSVRELLGTRRLRDLSAATHGKHVSANGETLVTGGFSASASGANGLPGGAAEDEKKEPYRVKAIRGIEFGSTEYAPGEDVDPLKCVWKNDDGTDSFERILWCEFKELDDSIYGFDQAIFRHTLETEELASLTFFKCFPPTEEGMAQAVELYNSMSAEASAELGFKLSEVDRSAENGTPILVGFTSNEGETLIRGKIEARSGKSIAVGLTVTDKPYQQELVDQGNAFYDAGLIDSVDSSVETHAKQDYSKPKDQAAALLK